MRRSIDMQRSQAGSFLLEALIAILIVALGVLGSVGLLGRSLQETSESRSRAEAAALANGLIAEMWMTDRLTTNLEANYSSAIGTGAGYTAFKALVDSRLPIKATTPPPDVVVDGGPIVPANPALQSNSMVSITVYWDPPGDNTTHKFDITASIGANQ